MKGCKKYSFLLFLVFCHFLTQAQTFWQDDFENAATPDIAAGSTRTAENNGGSGAPPHASYFKRTNGSDISMVSSLYSLFSNTYFWAGEDHDTPFGVGNEEQQIEWTSINISGKSNITFKGLFGANSTNASWDNFNTGSAAPGYGVFTNPSNDYIIVEYAVDAGAYTQLISFFGSDVPGGGGVGKKLQEDTNGDFIGDGTILNQAMTEFTKNITVSGSTMKIRIRVFSNGGSEEWAIDNFRLSTNVTNTTWNGTTWSNGVPTSSVDAIIANTTAPASFTCKSLTINSGSALNTLGITATVNGNIINNGSGIIGTGNLVIASNAALSGSAINYVGNITVNAGATLTTNNLLTLVSNINYTGSIGNSAGSISGNVTVQRYIPAGRRVYRFLSHPFTTDLAMSSLTDNIDITGSGGTPFTTTVTNNPSVFGYNNATANSSLSFDPGWSNLTAGSSFTAKAGYRILIRGSKGQSGSLTGGTYTPDAVTLDWSGVLNSGNQTFTLPYGGVNQTYSLIGNPYASPIDLSLLTRGSNVNANFSIWNPNMFAKGAYETQAFSIPYILPSGSAFFTQTVGNTNNTITFTEASKSTSLPAAVFRTNNSIGERLILEVYDTNANYADKLELFLDNKNNNYTTNYDALWDAEKLINPDVNLYSFSKDEKKLAIDRRPLKENDTIQLGFTSTGFSSYVFRVKELPDINTNTSFYLRDKWLNTNRLLEVNKTLIIDVVNDAQSQGNNRFEIITLLKKVDFPVLTTELIVSVSPNPASENVNIVYTGINTNETTQMNIINAEGKIVKMLELGKSSNGKQSINIASLSKGLYTLQLINGKNLRTEKFIVQ